mgnify:CR=1 FL=1
MNKIEPDHYKSDVEAIDAIEAWELGFCLGNTIKYISRCGKKSGETKLDDLNKAKWYLERAIAQLKR